MTALGGLDDRKQAYRIVWCDEPLPTGGAVALFNEAGRIFMLIDRLAFSLDPFGVMAEFEAHANANCNGYGAALLFPEPIGPSMAV